MVPRLDVVVLNLTQENRGHKKMHGAYPGELSVLVVKTTPVGDGAFQRSPQRSEKTPAGEKKFGCLAASAHGDFQKLNLNSK